MSVKESYAGKINRKLNKEAPRHRRGGGPGSGGSGAEKRHLRQRILQ